MSQQDKIGRVATTVRRGCDGVLRVTYHATVVVSVYPNGDIRLDSGGWRTLTTKTRMNQAAHQFALNFTVLQRNFDWYVVRNYEWEHEIPFEDGMILPASVPA